MKNVHSAIARWLLAAPLAGCCGSANADSQATVTLREAQSTDAGKVTPSVADASAVTAENCTAVCTAAQPNHTAVKSCAPVDAGEPTADCLFNNSGQCVGGRMPCGLVAPGDARSYFARMAHDEDASVHAFEHLARELAAHGAPPSLVRGAERAAIEEVRHAELMSVLARREGAAPPHAVVAPMPVRALVDVAIENAAEGCARETWGALLAADRARTEREDIQAAFAEIARDEASHAELSWRIDAWARTQLSSADVARVDGARRAAIAGLRDELAGASSRVRALFEAMAAEV